MTRVRQAVADVGDVLVVPPQVTQRTLERSTMRYKSSCVDRFNHRLQGDGMSRKGASFGTAPPSPEPIGCDAPHETRLLADLPQIQLGNQIRSCQPALLRVCAASTG